MKEANGLTWPLSLLFHPALYVDTAPGARTSYSEATCMRERVENFRGDGSDGADPPNQCQQHSTSSFPSM